ncbi:hypothetical protein K7432_014061 [Basidiobolus ranarum]|uniref:SOSS complex subunit A homolog n=1 Tax=Basidiobolus ranarum TaxID=34480 RepID=A0ABR2WI77_9FUNG
MFKQPFVTSKISLSSNDTQPLNVDVDVGKAIHAMDQQYGTQFETWIRNESNTDCVVFYLRKFIIEFEDNNPSAIARAVKWIVQGWSVQKLVELLIKLFYHWGVGHPKFVSLVSELSQDWRMPLVVDLVATLVVGENSCNTASFIQLFTQSWEPFMVIQLCRNIATRLRWNDRYCHQFLLRYATLTYPEGPTQRVVLNQIHNQFETRNNMLHHYYNPSKMDSGSLFLSPVDFTMTVLEVMVRDLKMYQSSHDKYSTLSRTKTYSRSKRISTNKCTKSIAQEKELTNSQFEETPQAISTPPTPRTASLLEKLSGPSSSNPNDGIILGLPMVDE